MASEEVVTLSIEGATHRISSLWLRLNDPNQHTVNGQRLFEISDVVDSAAATKVARHSTSVDGDLDVEWADGYAAHFPRAWLDQRLLKPTFHERSDQAYLWRAGIAKHLPTVEWGDVVRKHSELSELSEARSEPSGAEASAVPSAKRSRKGEAATNGKLQLACHMTTYGFAIVHNVPTVKGAVAQFGNAVGHVRTTNYGDIFDVIDLSTSFFCWTVLAFFSYSIRFLMILFNIFS